MTGRIVPAFDLAFEDIYCREGLERLDRQYLHFLKSRNSKLHDQLLRARAPEQHPCTSNESELILELAPHLSIFGNRKKDGTIAMTYVVTEACVRCKIMDCVDVCPVDCFYEGETMLAIDPDVCIDCGVCEPECPAEAIKADTAPGAEAWVQLNRDKSRERPNITTKGTPPADADQWIGVESKFESVFGVPPPNQGA